MSPYISCVQPNFFTILLLTIKIKAAHQLSLDKSKSKYIRSLPTDLPFYSHRFGNRQAVRSKNIAGLSVTVPGLSISVTGLLTVVYGLSVSL